MWKTATITVTLSNSSLFSSQESTDFKQHEFKRATNVNMETQSHVSYSGLLTLNPKYSKCIYSHFGFRGTFLGSLICLRQASPGRGHGRYYYLGNEAFLSPKLIVDRRLVRVVLYSKPDFVCLPLQLTRLFNFTFPHINSRLTQDPAAPMSILTSPTSAQVLSRD